jgi:hypothetical protein
VAYGKLVLNDKTEILFELDEDYRGPCGFSDIAEEAKQDFERIMKLIRDTALNAHSSFMKMPKEAMPSEYSLSFGIKLSTTAGAVFAKVGTEGNFQVTLKWTDAK